MDGSAGFRRGRDIEAGGVSQPAVTGRKLIQIGQQRAGHAGPVLPDRMLERTAAIFDGLQPQSGGRTADGGKKTLGVLGEQLVAQPVMHIEPGGGPAAALPLQLRAHHAQQLVLGRTQGQVGEVKVGGQRPGGQDFRVAIKGMTALAGGEPGIKREAARDEYFPGAGGLRLAMAQPQHGIDDRGIVIGGRTVIEQGEADGQLTAQCPKALFQHFAIRSGQYFIGVEGQNPVGAVGLRGEARQVVAASLLKMTDGIISKERDGQALALEGAENLPGAVGAVVVENEVAVHPGQRMPDEGLDDIGLVLDDGDCHQTHGSSVRIQARKRSQN